MCKSNRLTQMPMNLVAIGQLIGIITLCCHQLNASNPTIITSSTSPIAVFEGGDLLTEDNFTSAFPIVCTTVGCVEGIATPGFQIEEYESFFGIPYAEPPVNNLRFAVSVSWLDIYQMGTLNHRITAIKSRSRNMDKSHFFFAFEVVCWIPYWLFYRLLRDFQLV